MGFFILSPLGLMGPLHFVSGKVDFQEGVYLTSGNIYNMANKVTVDNLQLVDLVNKHDDYCSPLGLDLFFVSSLTKMAPFLTWTPN